MPIVDKKVDVVLKAWEVVQGVARSCDESASRVRTLALPAWGAIVAYAYSYRDLVILCIAFLLLIFACFVETIIRHVQYAFILRSFEIEKALGAYIVDDVEAFLSVDVGTHTPRVTLRRFIQLFSLRRAANWLPYLVAALATIVIFLLWGTASSVEAFTLKIELGK